jgi:hypothetical protein
MEKKLKKNWLEFYVFPSEFFEGIGTALTLLGNLFMFKSEKKLKPKLPPNKTKKEV